MTHHSLSHSAQDLDADDAFSFPKPEPITPEAFATIEQTLNALRPAVQRDGGDLELVDIQENIVRVRLKGACVGCSLAAQTLGGLRRALVKALSNPGIRVVPAV